LSVIINRKFEFHSTNAPPTLNGSKAPQVRYASVPPKFKLAAMLPASLLVKGFFTFEIKKLRT